MVVVAAVVVARYDDGDYDGDEDDDEQKGKRDHSWNHYHGSISAVPFGKRDHRTIHKRKRDHRN